MKLNLASGAHPLPNFQNLDKDNGWLFEEGLRDYADGTIEAVTESHGLMYVALANWPFVFSEFARVLEPGGVVRITEDATDDPASERFGGYHDAVTLTSAKLIAYYLLAAGLEPRVLSASQTTFRDDSLRQSWHGAEPKVCYVEGIKP